MLKLKLKVRLKSELRVRIGAGGGSGAGGWIWRLEQELEWQPELDLEAGVGAEAEGTKSSEIPPWGPQIRILGPNGGFISNMVVFQKDFDENMATFKTRKCHIRPGRPSHTIPTFTAGLPSKVHFKRTLGTESTSLPPHFRRFPSY